MHKAICLSCNIRCFHSWGIQISHPVQPHNICSVYFLCICTCILCPTWDDLYLWGLTNVFYVTDHWSVFCLRHNQPGSAYWCPVAERRVETERGQEPLARLGDREGHGGYGHASLGSVSPWARAALPRRQNHSLGSDRRQVCPGGRGWSHRSWCWGLSDLEANHQRSKVTVHPEAHAWCYKGEGWDLPRLRARGLEQTRPPSFLPGVATWTNSQTFFIQTRFPPHPQHWFGWQWYQVTQYYLHRHILKWVQTCNFQFVWHVWYDISFWGMKLKQYPQNPSQVIRHLHTLTRTRFISETKMS